MEVEGIRDVTAGGTCMNLPFPGSDAAHHAGNTGDKMK